LDLLYILKDFTSLLLLIVMSYCVAWH